MIVVLAAGSTQFHVQPARSRKAMTAFIAQAASGDQPTGSIGYESLFAVAALLFVITVMMNFISIRWSVVPGGVRVTVTEVTPPARGAAAESGID